MLFVLAFPASSFTVKVAPFEKPDAAGSLMSSADDAETPKILSLTEDVVVLVTAVLENTVDDNVTVTSVPLFVAVTAAPTKLKLVALVVLLTPSSFTIIFAPDSELMSVNFSSRYFPTYK